jgi:hypothetical protein
MMTTRRTRLFLGKGMLRSYERKKQQDSNTFRGDDDLNDEKRRVNQQEMKTPGRRGEKIKQEELDREFSRRSMEKRKKELNQNPKL